MAYTHGAGADPFSLAGETGKLQKFDVVSVTPSTSRDTGVHRDENGEYVPATLRAFNEREEMTVVYEANDNGAVGGGAITVTLATNYAVTSIGIVPSNGAQLARVTVTAHKHVGGTSTAHATNARSITLPAFNGAGVVDFTGSTVTAADVTGASWTATIDHVDTPNNLGNWLIGKATGVTIEATIEQTTDTPLTSAPSGWTIVPSELPRSQDGFLSQRVTLRQYLAAVA